MIGASPCAIFLSTSAEESPAHRRRDLAGVLARDETLPDAEDLRVLTYEDADTASPPSMTAPFRRPSSSHRTTSPLGG